MQDLRLVERRDQTLILETEDGAEFYLDVNEEVIGVVQAIARSLSAKVSDVKVRPREVQALLRGGQSRNEVAHTLQISIEDVERYAGPIDAEFRFIMDQVRNVAVRATGTDGDEPQRFGEVIEDRLDQLGADDFTWSTWKDEEEGWVVLLLFSAHGVDHEARWKFDHRKRLLTPVTPDAINLSKQGDVGDKLIPTLRAVDTVGDPPVFDAASVAEEEAPARSEDETHEQVLTEADDLQAQAPHDDFERIQGIEQRAIVSEPEPQDLGQTSDLLDALRKRRHDRVQESQPSPSASKPAEPAEPIEGPRAGERPVNIWGSPATSAGSHSEAPQSVGAQDEHSSEQRENSAKTDERKAKKGRTSIPSWDEILFGTRSDDD